MWEEDYYVLDRFKDFKTSLDSLLDKYKFNDDFRFNDDFISAEIWEKNDQAETLIEKLDSILGEVLLEFSDCGLKTIKPDFPFDWLDPIEEKIFIEGNHRETSLTYDPETHEISGFVEMSLGDRDLTEITDDEVGKIQKALLIWIYENI